VFVTVINTGIEMSYIFDVTDISPWWWLRMNDNKKLIGEQTI